MRLPKPSPRFYAGACALSMLGLLFCMAVAKVLVCGPPFGNRWWSAPILRHEAGMMVGLYFVVVSTIGISVELYRHWALAERMGGAEEEEPFLRRA